MPCGVVCDPRTCCHSYCYRKPAPCYLGVVETYTHGLPSCALPFAKYMDRSGQMHEISEDEVRYRENCAERLEFREPGRAWRAELAVVLAGRADWGIAGPEWCGVSILWLPI